MKRHAIAHALIISEPWPLRASRNVAEHESITLANSTLPWRDNRCQLPPSTGCATFKTTLRLLPVAVCTIPMRRGSSEASSRESRSYSKGPLAIRPSTSGVPTVHDSGLDTSAICGDVVPCCDSRHQAWRPRGAPPPLITNGNRAIRMFVWRHPKSETKSQLEVRRDPTVLAKPFAIFNIELTNRCPFRCVMCARTHGMARAQGDMTFDIFRRVIDEFAAINPEHARSRETWMHGFGESAVHPHLAEFLTYATDKGVNACLSVNPLMLTPAVGRALLEARPGTLYLALDGHDDKSFENIRGLPNVYEKSKQRLLDFIDMKQKMGSRTHLVLSMINFRLNDASINAMADWWRDTAGLDEVLLKQFTVWDGSVRNVNILRRSTFEKGDKVVCIFPFEKMTVCWDGNVTPCCYDYDEKYVLGNVSNQSLMDIWNAEPMRRLRREFLENNVTNNLCRSCPALYGLDG